MAGFDSPPAKKRRGLGMAHVKTLSNGEFEYVDTSPKGRKFWMCKVCNDSFSKRTARDHLQGVHHLELTDMTKWIVLQDQSRVKGCREHMCELELATNVSSYDSQVVASSCDDEGAAGQDAVIAGGAGAAGDEAVVPVGAADGVASGGGSVHGSQLVPPQVLVKCKPDGTPFYPLQYVDMPQDSLRPIAVNASDSLAKAAPSSGVMAPDLAAAISSIHEIVQRQDASTKWADKLPKVSVKPDMLNITAPLRKGEGGTLRAAYPIDKAKLPEVDEFLDYLRHSLNKAEAQSQALYLGLRRFLHFWQFDEAGDHSDVTMTSPEVLVAMFKFKQVKALCGSPLFDAKHCWTKVMIQGAIHYVQFHKQELSRYVLHNSGSHYVHYFSSLDALIHELKAGHFRRCMQLYHESMQAKMEEDREALQNMPSVEVLQRAVHEAYMVLQWVTQTHTGAVTAPLRRLVNACMAGGIAFDTFAGRKGEWESLLWDYVQKEVLQNGHAYVICKKHKTSKTYGELCKRLTPGLHKAFQSYSLIERPEGCTTFLVPVHERTEKVSLPHALKCFCKLFLPEGSFHPWYNLVRKWFHNTLMQLTKDEKKLKEFMVKMDAHSVSIQDKHYIIRSPKDDVALADQLIQHVLTQPVPWPSWGEVQSFVDAKGGNVHGYIPDTDVEDTQELHGEAEMEFWEFGEMFGVAMPKLIQDAIQGVGAQGGAMMPLANEPPAAPMIPLAPPPSGSASSSGMPMGSPWAEASSSASGVLPVQAPPPAATVPAANAPAATAPVASAPAASAQSISGIDVKLEPEDGTFPSAAHKQWFLSKVPSVNGGEKNMKKKKAPSIELWRPWITEGIQLGVLPSPEAAKLTVRDYEEKVRSLLRTYREP